MLLKIAMWALAGDVMCRFKLILASIVGLALMVSANACTVNVPLEPKAGLLGVAHKRLPVSAALLITDQLSNYILRDYPDSFTGATREHVFPLGQAVERASIQVFSQIFNQLVVVRDIQEAKKYDLYLTPEIENFHFEYDQLSYAGFAIAVVVKITIRGILSSGDSIIWQLSVESPEQRAGPWAINFSFEKETGYATCKAIVYDLKKIAIDIITNPKLLEFVSGLGKNGPVVTAKKHNASNVPNVVSTGSGFVVNSEGYIVTNYHVIKGAKFIKEETTQSPLQIIAVDRHNDLALLKAENITMNRTVVFRSPGKRVRPGEKIIVIGFPLQQVLAREPHVTIGNISATAGIGDDRRYFQFTAPIQVGNSGGPVLDQNGSVIGVVVAKLSEAAMVEATGTLPQNVNFALHGAVVKAFLETNNIAFQFDENPKGKSTPDIADAVKGAVLLIQNWQ